MTQTRKALILVLVLIIIVSVTGVVLVSWLYRGSQAQATSNEIQLVGDFAKDVVAIGRVLERNGVSEVKFSVWGSGDPNSVMRVYGIVEAVRRINKIWEDNGIKTKIIITETRYVSNFQDAYKEYLSKQPLGIAGDFFVNSYAFLPTLAEEGYILDITNYVKAYQNIVNSFYPSLIEASKHKGKLYGLPQDTEARPLYVRKDVASKIGLDIDTLPEKVKKGEFTWSDVYYWAKKAKESGIEWGLLHRRGSAHPDLIQFIFALNGTLYDEKTGKLVLDVPAVYKWLYIEWKFAQDGLLPKDMLSWDWDKQVHPTIVEGRTLFDIGGTWYWTQWQTNKYYQGRGLTPEETEKWFGYTLFPAGEKGNKPVTLSQPFVWMINSMAGSQNPRYSELKNIYHQLAFLIIVKASDPDINAIHSIISAHLPVRREAAELLKDTMWLNMLRNLNLDLDQTIKNNIKDIVQATVNPINAQFLANVSYMLEYTRLAPSHPKYPALADIFAEVVDKVLRGQMTPEQGVSYIIQKINSDLELARNINIVGEIPRDWRFPS